MLDVKLITKFMNVLIFERTPIIHDNGQGNAIQENNVIKDKCGYFFTSDMY